MHIITRGVVAVAVASMGLLAVAGCAAQQETGRSASPSTTTAPTPTEAASTIAFGGAPATTGVPSCEELLPTDLVTAVVPGAKLRDPLADQAYVFGAWSTATANGGTDCWSTNGVSPLEDVSPGRAGDPMYEGVSLSVLPDASPEYADATAHVDPSVGDVGPVWCSASDSARLTCSGRVLAGHAWIDLSSTRLQSSADATPEQAEPLFRALLDRVQQTVAAAPVADVSTEHDPASWKPTTCTTDRLDPVTSERLIDPWSLGSDVGADPVYYSINRLGGAACTFSKFDQAFSSVGATYSSLPDSGWVVSERLDAGVIDRQDRLELDGLGDDAGAWRTCDDSGCSVDVVQDGTWTHYVLFAWAAPDTSSAIERWVESSFSA